MKTKTILTTACILVVSMLAAYHAKAQATQPVKPATVQGKKAAAEYTYKVFQAPNKMYGYDIFYDGKIRLHQGASAVQENNSIAVLAKKEQADKAALLVIEKLKKNQPAVLTQEELKKVTTP